MEKSQQDSTMLTLRDRPTVVIEAGLLLLVNVFAFTGNLLICLVMYNKPRFHTTTNTFTLALSVCYEFIACLVMPFAVGSLISGKWVFGQVLCDIQAFSFLTLTWISLLTLTILTVSRFFQVTHLSIYNKWFSLNRCYGMVMIIWVVVIAGLICAEAVGIATFRFSPHESLCSISFSKEKSSQHTTYAVVTLVFYITLPVVSLIILIAIRRHNANVHSIIQPLQRRSDQDVKKSAQEHRTNCILLALTIGVLVFWLPAVVIKILSFPIRLPRQVHLVSTLFWFAVPALHPVIYGALHRPFTREVLRVLPLSRKRKNRVHAEEAI